MPSVVVSISSFYPTADLVLECVIDDSFQVLRLYRIPYANVHGKHFMPM